MFKRIGKIKSSKGFTLLEVLIGMSISLIGITGGYALLANIQGTAAGNRVLVQAQQEARNVVERLAREIRESSPGQIYLDPGDESDSIYFWIPRDENNEFVVGANGKPKWQRRIFYKLDYDTHHLYRYKSLESSHLEQMEQDTGESEWLDTSHREILSEHMETVNFQRVDDMIVISVRTFAESNGKVGHVVKSYADFSTMVKLRN